VSRYQVAFAIAAVCAAIGTRAESLDEVLGSYAALPGKKALAVAQIDSTMVSGVADSQPSASAAAFTALERCEQARVRASVDAVCEVIRNGATTVATGASIKATTANEAHPLFLWRYQTSAGTVFLAGSIHVMKGTLYPLPPQFDAAFSGSDRLAVEVDTVNASQETLRQTTLQYALLPSGTTIAAVISPATFAKLSALLTDEEIPLESVERLRPAILSTQLAVTRLVALGYLPTYGLETYFITRAGPRPILQLETMEDQFEALTSPPPKVQEEMLLETIEQMPTIEPVVTAMLTAWFGGDDAEFLRLFELQSGTTEGYRKFMHRILDERNLTMAERISGYLAGGGTTFVLVGSAHLAGDAGIPAILSGRGYPGHRVFSDEDINVR
jgi:uncharacterized protein